MKILILSFMACLGNWASAEEFRIDSPQPIPDGSNRYKVEIYRGDEPMVGHDADAFLRSGLAYFSTLSEQDRKSIESEIDGSLIGLKENLQAFEADKVTLISKSPSELAALKKFMDKAQYEFDEDKARKINGALGSCIRAKNPSKETKALYVALGTIASMKSCAVSTLKIEEAALVRSLGSAKGNSTDCPVSIKPDIASSVGSIEIVGTDGATQSIRFSNHLEPAAVKPQFWLDQLMPQLREKKFCSPSNSLPAQGVGGGEAMKG